MELGQLLKQARLEAGLSQRQLCGDHLTRNMLSLIENGSARPSMDTLQYLAAQLRKPVSYFLQEKSVSPNQARLAAARQAFFGGDAHGALEILNACQRPDPDFDPERYLLEALCCMALEFPDQAAEAAAQTPYCRPDAEARWMLWRGDAALAGGDPQTALKWFSLAEPLVPEQAWPRLEACHRTLEDYKMAYRYACLQRK